MQLTGRDWLLILAMGLGPLGAAFFCGTRRSRLGDARHIGILSYLTPLLSTAMLLMGQRPRLDLAGGAGAAC